MWLFKWEEPASVMWYLKFQSHCYYAIMLYYTSSYSPVCWMVQHIKLTKNHIFPLEKVYILVWKLHSPSKIAQTLKIWPYLVNMFNSLSKSLSWPKSLTWPILTWEPKSYSKIPSTFQSLGAITCLCAIVYSIFWWKYFAIVYSFEVLKLPKLLRVFQSFAKPNQI